MAYSVQAVADHFHVQLGDLKPSYNVSPGREIAAVRLEAGTGKRELALLHWGLVPSWARRTNIDDHLIFARAETVMQKPAYREAFGTRRCLIPADGFYEWGHEGHQKQPYFVRMRNGHLFAFGGIWERHEGKRGTTQAIESCAVLTTESNQLVKSLHNRMPLIIRPEHYDLWLDPQTPLEQVVALLRPYPAREMTAYPVSEKVNHPRIDEPALIEPVEKHPGEESGLFHPLVEELHRAKPRGRSRAKGPGQ